MSISSSRTILANMVSDIMAEDPSDSYRLAMSWVTPRKLWQASPGDCVVTLAPVGGAFADYVSETLGLDLSTVEIVAPSTPTSIHALDVARSVGRTQAILDRPVLKPFVIDRPTLDFCKKTGLRIDGYGALPPDEVIGEVSRVNTKDGFRAVAISLGLPVPNGGHASTIAALEDGLERSLSEGRPVIVKTARASNGQGHTVFEPHESRVEVKRKLGLIGEAGAARSCGWVYEDFLPSTGAPSIEMCVSDDAVTFLYSCDQRVVNNAWRGMVTPMQNRDCEVRLTASAEKFGEWLQSHGYRGIYDVDFVSVNDDFYLTEANVRRTGGTYLHELATRIRGDARSSIWHADSRVGKGTLTFEAGVDRLRRASLANALGDRQVVLTADTREMDGKWRYLIVADDASAAAEAEVEVAALLGLD